MAHRARSPNVGLPPAATRGREARVPAEPDDMNQRADLRPTRDYDGFAVYEWMWAKEGLGLPTGSTELLVYAKIYAVSHHGTGVMTASQPKLAALFGVARETVNRILADLVDKGLIYVCGEWRAPGRGARAVNVYAACQAPVERAVSAAPSVADPVVWEGNVTGTSRWNVMPASHCNVSRTSHCNVTGKSNVTQTSHCDSGPSTSGNESFQQNPLITKTNPDPKSGESGRGQRTLTEVEEAAFQKLVGMSLKEVRGIYMEETRGLFLAAIDDGVTPETLLLAYGEYRRTLLDSKKRGGLYRPMSLSHWLQKGRQGDDYNSWIVDARDGKGPASAEAAATEIAPATDGTWVAFPLNGQPEVIPIKRGAEKAAARAAWERETRRRWLEQGKRRQEG